MIKIIIFDFDGVIENTYELHYTLMQKQITGITREEHRRLFEGNINVEREKLKHRNTGFDVKKHLSDAIKEMVINPEIKEVLTIISKNYILGVVTSVKEYGIHGYFLKNNIEGLFSFVYGYETAEMKSAKFEKVLQDHNVTQDECLFVTDTLGDIVEANEVGIKAIALDSGYHERERLQKGYPAQIISHIGELVPLLNLL